MSETLELLPSVNSEINIYSGASMLQISEDETKKISASFDEKEIEIRPDGLIYLPQAFFRKRLNETFGFGQWCLIPKGSHKDISGKDKMYLQGALLVRGSFVAEAVGEAELHSSNPLQSWASVWESAKSDSITRCCKDLGIASELWQPEFIKAWIAKNAVQVWREKTGKKKDGTPGSFQWRKKTAEKFWDERTGEAKPEAKATAPAPDSAKSEPTAPAKKLIPISTRQYTQALERVAAGEIQLLDMLTKIYTLTERQKTDLIAAYRPAPAKDPEKLAESVIDTVNKITSLKALFDYKEACDHLKDNAEFNALIEKKRLEITFPKQNKKS